jgi:hypothetical protein
MKIIAKKELSGPFDPRPNEAQALEHVLTDFNIIQTPEVAKRLAQREPFHGAMLSATSPTFSETLSATHTKLSKCKYRSVFFNHVRP